MRKISEIGSLIQTQDNRITDAPIFVVQQIAVDWGLSSAHCDDYKWIHPKNDYSEADEEEANKLDELDRLFEDLDGWEKAYYKERWEFVTACFTEEGCKDYIRQNGHNLKRPRIYAEGSHRNDEWRTVRNHLISESLATIEGE